MKCRQSDAYGCGEMPRIRVPLDGVGAAHKGASDHRLRSAGRIPGSRQNMQPDAVTTPHTRGCLAHAPARVPHAHARMPLDLREMIISHARSARTDADGMGAPGIDKDLTHELAFICMTVQLSTL